MMMIENYRKEQLGLGNRFGDFVLIVRELKYWSRSQNKILMV